MLKTKSEELGQRPVGKPPQAAPSILKLDFATDRTFENDVRRRVDEYFERSGRSRQASLRMYVKTGIILALFLASYLLLVFRATNAWQGLALAVALGLSVAGIGFNIAHDGGHGAYSKTARVNRLMAITMDLVGVSSYVWFWKHAVIHHRFVNITGYDTDIDLGLLARLSPHSPRLAFHRWQHIYLWFLYGFVAAKMQFVDDLKRVIRGRIGGHRFPRPRRRDVVILIAGKVVFLLWAFCIPLIFHPLGAVLFFYCVGVSVLGILLSVVFQLPHCVAQADFPVPEEETGRMKNPWAVHQAQVTLAFARKSRTVTWPLGGLNFHLEHHLFPTICSIHYPAITKIVEETCRDHGVKYAEHPTFRSGIASHYRWLKLMGTCGNVSEGQPGVH